MSININDGLWGNGAPIIIPYGQTSSGKTTAMVRLIKYLQKKGYSYDICQTFHDKYYPHDEYYPKEKRENIQSFYTKQLQRPINEIEGNAVAFLCNIKSDRGSVVCRFLESPGENLFALQEAAKQDIYKDGGIVIGDEFQYLLDIIKTEEYKKIWVFFMDPGFTQELENEKPAYIARIKQIAKTLRDNDNVIFLVNKEDIVKNRYARIIQEEGYKGYINHFYEGLLNMEPFTTKTIRWYWPFSKKTVEKFRIVPFQSYDTIGKGKDTDGNQMVKEYELSTSSYPAKLWNTIQAAIKNKF